DERMAQIIVEKQEVIDKALDVAPQATNDAPFVQVLDIIPPPPPEHIPGTIITETITREELEKRYPSAPSTPIVVNRSFTDEQEQAVLAGLRQLSAMCDGAYAVDGHGFNKRDTNFGKSLACNKSL